MQKDMHYYGVYAIARAAGLNVERSKTIAYASQYVDDSIAENSVVHKDGGMFATTATAHSNSDVIKNQLTDNVSQREVWVPFHFFPGNEGTTLSEKLLCRKNSALAQEMVENHIEHAVSNKDSYGLTLIGITAHVYADTFSHYGFSGVSSRENAVNGDSFKFEIKDDAMITYVQDKFWRFMHNYTPNFIIDNWRKIASGAGDIASGTLGHGAVSTYPDRPFLKWSFKYNKNAESSERDNPVDYLEGWEKLHGYFVKFAIQAGLQTGEQKSFDDIKDTIKAIIEKEAVQEGRITAWKDAVNQGKLFVPNDHEALSYNEHEWEFQKTSFSQLEHSSCATDKEVYQFHQAATYHCDYTLKQLLPKHGIVVL